MVGPIKRRGQGCWVSGRRRLRGQASSPVAEALRRRVAVRARRRRQAIAKLYAVIERPTGSAKPVSADASTRPSFRACPSTPGLATTTTARRLETRPGRPPRRMDVHASRGGPLQSLSRPQPTRARRAASRLFRETPSNLADRVLQPADRVLERAVAEAAGRSKPQPIMGTKPRRAERSEGRTMNPRDRLLWYAGRGRYRRAAGPRRGRRLVWAHRAAAPRRRRNDAAVNSPGEWARRSPRYGLPGATAGTAGSGGRAAL